MTTRESLNQEALSRELYPIDGPPNITNLSPVDAFRHAAASALAADAYGSGLARLGGAMQEAGILGPSDDYVYEDSGIMDEHNNRVGRDVSRSVPIGPQNPRDINRSSVREEAIFDEVEKLVRAGVTINSVNDPRIDQIRDNLLPGESVAQMLARTNGVVPGPRGTGYDIWDPRGPWQDPNMMNTNVRGPLGPDTSPRPASRPDWAGSQGSGTGPSDPHDPRGPWQTPGAPGDRTGGVIQRSGDSAADRIGGSGGGAAQSGQVGTSAADRSTTTSVTKNSDGYTSGTTKTVYSSGVSQTTTKQTVNTPSGPKEVTKTTTKAAPAPKDDPKRTGPQPVLLDLDGNGVKISQFQSSTQFQTGKDGLSHRTSWAGTGDGVLFYDAGNDNLIMEEREYVFTEWNPTAQGDLEALRSVWDTNGDGKLTAADAAGGQVTKVIPTQTGGTRTLPRRLRSARPRRAIGDWRTVSPTSLDAPSAKYMF
jgi:hypothetical protein